jgi:phospholipid/cholesterol/gamma-HCH transport system substrate-binding protein
MEKSTSSTIRLGIFVTIGALIFTVAVYLIGQKQSLFSETFTLRAHFSNVNGLQPGNNVRFVGINVGSVTQVTILNDSVIEVRMRIRESVRSNIKKNALASIGTDGLMGNMLLNISSGRGYAPPVGNDDLIESYSRIKTDDILNTLNVTNDNAALLTHNLLEITEQVKHGQGTISELIYEKKLRDEVVLTFQNLRLTAEKTNTLVQQLNQITTEVNKGRGTIGWLLTDTLTDDQVQTTLVKLQQTGDRLQAVTDSIQLVLRIMREGDGTLPMLLNDSIAANDLRQTFQNLNEGSALLKENMEAMRSNWLLRKYFKDQEKEQKK